jgi:hypothetical protein
MEQGWIRRAWLRLPGRDAAASTPPVMHGRGEVRFLHCPCSMSSLPSLDSYEDWTGTKWDKERGFYYEPSVMASQYFRALEGEQ